MDYYLELYHHGILGQKWGVRRYQNKDGSLTSQGKHRYRINKSALNPVSNAKNELKRQYVKGAQTHDGKTLVKNLAAIGAMSAVAGLVAGGASSTGSALKALSKVTYDMIKDTPTTWGAKAVNGMYYSGIAITAIGAIKAAKLMAKAGGRALGTATGAIYSYSENKNKRSSRPNASLDPQKRIDKFKQKELEFKDAQRFIVKDKTKKSRNRMLERRS